MSLKLYLGNPDATNPVSDSESDDDSISITSEDDVENEVLFLFRFWVNTNTIHRRPHHITEREVDADSIQEIESIIEDYDMQNYGRVIEDLMTGPLIEI